jgi:hypothetical protein
VHISFVNVLYRYNMLSLCCTIDIIYQHTVVINVVCTLSLVAYCYHCAVYYVVVYCYHLCWYYRYDNVPSFGNIAIVMCYRY